MISLVAILVALGAAPSSVAAPETAAPAAAADGGTPEAMASPDGGPPAAAATPPAPAAPELQPADVDEVLKEYKKFSAEADEYRKEIQLIIERRFEDRRAAIDQNFETSIKDLEVDERQMRLDAIGQFEAFLAKYPDERRFSPDAMFRLAELYYEKTEDDALVLAHDNDEKLRQGIYSEANPPPELKHNYDRPIALYQDMITRFPDYPLLDGVYYLLGYVLKKQDEGDQARDVWLTMIDKYPRSRFVPEAWVRIGELYFDYEGPDANDALQRAIAAFSKVLDFPDHPLYDKAIYKLAWSYYRLADDQHPEYFQKSVDVFIKLVDFYEAQKQLALKKGEDFKGGDLRNESLKYVAISFADDKWGSPQKAIDYFAQIGPRPYKAEFFKMLGDVFYDETKHPEAIACYQVLLTEDPNSVEAPATQEKIIQAYERDRNFDKAADEIVKLVANYGEGSRWAETNKHEPETLEKTRDLIEKRLRSSATRHHQQALEYKKAAQLDKMKAEYEKAAAAYGDYLKRYPHAKDIYDVTFFYAETLYSSLDFQGAAAAYAKVRDDNTDNKYQTDAARGAVLALKREVEREQRAGTLADLPTLYAKDRKEGEKIVPIPIPELLQKFIAAADAFVKAVPKDEEAPSYAYTAAETFYKYNQYDEARKRFADIVKRWPQDEVAAFASNLSLETWLSLKDWEKVEQTAKQLLADRIKFIKPDKAEELRKLMMSARFNRAMAFYAAQKWDDAAKLFVSTVDEDPQFQFGDVAINNAAAAYSQAQRHDSAMQMYKRLYTQFSTSKFADGALFLVGLEAEKAFDFDEAIARYDSLVHLAKFAASEKRPDALYNLAHLYERTQQYDKAAKAFAEYGTTFRTRDDAPQMLFQSALVYEKTAEYKREIDELGGFISRYRSDPKQDEKIVDSYLKIAQAWRALKNDGLARRSYQDCVDEFDRRHMTPDKTLAAAAAAESRYQLAEADFGHFDELKIEGFGKGKKFETSLAKALTTKVETMQKVTEAYGQVIVKYQRADWTICSLYRMGFANERFAQSLYDAPVPSEIKKLGEDYVNQYKDSLAEKAIVLEDKALAAYKRAFEKAKQLAIANDCTQRIQEGLDKYDHKNFPLLKTARAEQVFELYSPLPVAPTTDGIPAPIALPPPVENKPAAPNGAAPNAAPGTPTAAGAAPAANAPAPSAGGKIGGDE